MTNYVKKIFFFFQIKFDYLLLLKCIIIIIGVCTLDGQGAGLLVFDYTFDMQISAVI